MNNPGKWAPSYKFLKMLGCFEKLESVKLLRKSSKLIDSEPWSTSGNYHLLSCKHALVYTEDTTENHLKFHELDERIFNSLERRSFQQ